MENSIFFDLFMGFCKICVLLTWLLGLFFSFVFLPYYTVRSIIEIIKGRTQARSLIALSTSGRHIEMISLPHPTEPKQ